MKRVLYINELLLCAVSIAFTSLHLYLFHEKWFAREYIVAYLIYGASAALLTNFLISDLKSKDGRPSAKETVFGTVSALPLFFMAVLYFLPFGRINLWIILIFLATIIVLATIWFKGGSKYVLIGIFALLTLSLLGAYVMSVISRVPMGTGYSSEYRAAHSWEFFIAENGGAAQFNAIPTMIAFLLADKFCDKMSCENA